ncbi:MAG: hypothetical protein JNJ46_10555 [Myxococcales bacterium]|nr:hypothetical protein [Myxococcales bacterium]
MTWQQEVTCKYHHQDGRTYCGPASAMMLLATQGVPSQTVNQAQIAEIIEHNKQDSTWHSDPAGLTAAINELLPRDDAFKYSYSQFETVYDSLHYIIDTIVTHRRPCVVPIYKNHHWSVVQGVLLDNTPDDPYGYGMQGLWLNIPFHKSIGNHSDSDQCNAAHGYGRVYVTYNSWITQYSFPITCAATGFVEQYVALCSAQSPAVPLPRFPKLIPSSLRRRRLKTDELLSLVQKTLAMYPALAAEMHRLDDVHRLLDVGIPRFVRYLDQGNKYYALVPMTSERLIHGVAAFDAHDGTLLSYHTLTEPRLQLLPSLVQLLPHLLRDPSIARYRSWLRDLPLLRPELVWQPCLQSCSPTLPFWHLQSPRGSLYVRVDGAIFTSLSLEVRG